jgi:hypothetical protein
MRRLERGAFFTTLLVLAQVLCVVLFGSFV